MHASSCHERININLFTLFSIFFPSPSFLISANLFSSTLGSTPWLSVMCSENNSVPGIWVSSNEVDEPGAYYTEWNKSEREKQISYINPCMWNLEQRYWWTSLQTEAQGERTDLWARARRGRGRWVESADASSRPQSQWGPAACLWAATETLHQPKWAGKSGKWGEVAGRFNREGTCVHLPPIHVDAWWKWNQDCKAVIL